MNSLQAQGQARGAVQALASHSLYGEEGTSAIVPLWPQSFAPLRFLSNLPVVNRAIVVPVKLLHDFLQHLQGHASMSGEPAPLIKRCGE
eukprot:1157531-Pelagomonas_calceolata.AAC.10